MIECTCPPLDGYSHVQWIGNYFGDCIRTPLEKLSFSIGIVSIFFYLAGFLPQFLHNFRRKSVQGLSLSMIIVWALGDLSNLFGTYLAQQLSSQKIIALSFIFLDVLILIQYFSYYDIYDSTDDDDVSSISSEGTLNESSSLLRTRRSRTSCSPNRGIITSTVLIACVGIVYGSQIMDSPVFCDDKPLMNSFAAILGTICGWLSGLSYFFSRIPQILDNFRLKSVEGLSFGLFTLTISGNLSYGLSILLRTPEFDEHFYFQTLPFIIGSLGVLIFDLIIMGQFLIYRQNSARNNPN